MEILGKPVENLDHTPPITAYVWDSISLEWGPAYPRVAPGDNLEVHAAICDFIDYQDQPEEGDEVLFRFQADHFYANIGVFGGRDHIWVEIWGDFADRVRAQLPDAWDPTSTVEILTDLASRYRTARR